MEQFLTYDMRGAIILNVRLPPLGIDTVVKTFKVMPRSQNAHALVNFGALFKLYQDSQKLNQCRIVFGGLKPGFTRAVETEKCLIGLDLFHNETLQLAVKMLKKELEVTGRPKSLTVFKKQLALSLFYKALLSICPENIINHRFKSGAIKLHESRPVSKAEQSYDTNPAMWPLTKPMPKIDSLIQCAGEAFYTEDMPSFPCEVFGNLVLSTIARGNIATIDTQRALSHPGVIAVYTAKDIPGLNSYKPFDDGAYSCNEKLLCTNKIKYYNQPLAIVVAETRHIAEIAASMVTVKYSNITTPVIDIKKAKTDPSRLQHTKSIPAIATGTDVAKVIEGSNTIYGQYHFSLENLSCVVRPTEEGIEVYVTTQWTDGVQTMISRALNMDANRIDVHVRRIGGSFGSKVTQSVLIAVAASLVVYKLNRPCRFTQSMQNVSRAFGKRFPCSSNYEFGVNTAGIIQYAKYSIFEDNGFTINEKMSLNGLNVYFNCYDKSRWSFNMIDVVTDTAKNSWFRAPGTLENIAMTEMVMEQISYELSLDPIDLRLANLDQKSDIIKDMLSTLLLQCDYQQRKSEIQRFNIKNRWKKRGLRFVPINWSHNLPRHFDVNLSVYHVDGTVSIVHGGVEMGQGINTRAIQITAYFLGIPMERIQIKASNTIFSPNINVTAVSITNQSIGIGVERCCKMLTARLESVKSQMSSPTWEELVAQAYHNGVDLQAHGYVSPEDIQYYNVYGVTFAEVEIDVLTGELEIRRVDIMEDAGQSISPEIDIGQVEGAFVMGLGYWTMENLVYDQNTGELLTDRTWNYYVPQARDIPQDLRVHLRKKSYSTSAILGSKAIAEPPMCMAVVIPFAIREAIVSARSEVGIPTTSWFPFDGPLTTESICLAACTRIEEFKFN